MKDVIILGGGPAGLTAAVYARRAGLDTLVIEKGEFGGQMIWAKKIDNFPGYPDGISGKELAGKLISHAEKFGAQLIQEIVTSIVPGDTFTVSTNNSDYQAKSIIVSTGIAIGSSKKELGIPGEERLTGAGVSYCATCDGFFFRNKTVCVVGGGQTAVEDALYLSNIAKKVYVINKGKKLIASENMLKKITASENIEILSEHESVEITGEESVEKLIVKETKSMQQKAVDCSGVFIAVGQHPQSDIFAGLLEIDNNGHIICDEKLATSIPKLFVAGDVRVKEIRQVVTACADGAIAASSAKKALMSE